MAAVVGMPTRFGMVMDFHPELMKRRHAVMMKAIMFKLPLVWQKMFLPEHFKPIAQMKYDYKERTAKYLRRKQKAKGHQTPMVFSWRTRNKSTRPPSITGTSRGAKGVFAMPWYIKMRPTTRNAPNLGVELVRTTEIETRQLAARVGSDYETEMRKHKPALRKKRSIT